MSPAEYKTLALRTNIDKGREHGLVHAALGIASEVGEIFELIRNDADLDGDDAVVAKFVAELGDLTWFVNLMCYHIGHEIKVTEAVKDSEDLGDCMFELQIASGTICDLVKKQVAYGRELEVSRAADCLDVIMQCVTEFAFDIGGYSLSDVMSVNIAKLEARYKGGKFDASLALNRDSATEDAAIAVAIQQ